MAYTKELIDEVIKLYPNDARIIELAENGSVWLGRYLCDCAPTGISIEFALACKTIEEVHQHANYCKRKINIYKKWMEQDPLRKKI